MSRVNQTPMPRPIIIDTDPSPDDAVAFLTALASPDELEVLAITTVAGNVPVQLTSKNARKILELAHRSETPVYAGASAPLTVPGRGAQSTTNNAVTKTGSDQKTRSNRQLSCRSGKTSGMVRPTGRISPISSPFV